MVWLTSAGHWSRSRLPVGACHRNFPLIWWHRHIILQTFFFAGISKTKILVSKYRVKNKIIFCFQFNISVPSIFPFGFPVPCKKKIVSNLTKLCNQIKGKLLWQAPVGSCSNVSNLTKLCNQIKGKLLLASTRWEFNMGPSRNKSRPHHLGTHLFYALHAPSIYLYL